MTLPQYYWISNLWQNMLFQVKLMIFCIVSFRRVARGCNSWTGSSLFGEKTIWVVYSTIRLASGSWIWGWVRGTVGTKYHIIPRRRKRFLGGGLAKCEFFLEKCLQWWEKRGNEWIVFKITLKKITSNCIFLKRKAKNDGMWGFGDSFGSEFSGVSGWVGNPSSRHAPHIGLSEYPPHISLQKISLAPKKIFLVRRAEIFSTPKVPKAPKILAPPPPGPGSIQPGPTELKLGQDKRDEKKLGCQKFGGGGYFI